MSKRRARGQLDRGGALPEKFHNRVIKSPESGCWIWDGNINTASGYGRLFFEGRNLMAHRVSYELHHGPVPAGMHVCHKCDNPPCVNPDHLLPGTDADNVADKMSKGRWGGGPLPGERNHNSKLTDAQVSEIKGLLKLPNFRGKCAQLGRAFGVDECAIHHIKSGRAWRHIT